MDSIIDQMMTVAEYIGWETKELRPVSPLLLQLYHLEKMAFPFYKQKLISKVFYKEAAPFNHVIVSFQNVCLDRLIT